MKKLFTLAALLLAASAVNAQYVTKALDANDESTFKWENASNFILFSVGEAEREAMEGKILADYNVNDNDVHLWVWDQTYVGGDGSGMNSFGQLEDHIALTVSNVGWSGWGMIKDGGIDLSMLDDTYVLHFALKSKPSDLTAHGFGFGEAKFTIGPSAFIDNGNPMKLLGDIGHDNEWYYVDIPFSVLKQCAANGEPFPASAGGPAAYSSNHLWCLSGGVQGAELHIDNIFIYKDATIVPEEPAKVYLIGDAPLGGWNPEAPIEMTEDEETEGLYTYTVNVEETKDIYFVFTEGIGSWDEVNGHRYGPTEANQDVVVGEDMTTQLSTNDQAAYKLAAVAGEYTITFNKNTMTFRVDGGVAPEPDYVLHYGHEGVEWQDATFVPGEGENEGKLVVADLAFDANTEFGVKYGETWFAGLPNEGEDNYVIHYGWCTDIPLSTGDNVKNFLINEAGTYTFLLTIGEEGNSLTVNGFTAPALPGDANGDGQVDISDVNSVINQMLGKEPMIPACDMNGDGKIDISDVNAVINKMLGK